MRVLVTGGAGFIGSQIVEALVAHGHEPVLYDVRADPASDVRDADAVRRALTGVDAVCHQAAMVGLGVDFADAPEYVSHNDVGTAVLLAAMAVAGGGGGPAGRAGGGVGGGRPPPAPPRGGPAGPPAAAPPGPGRV